MTGTDVAVLVAYTSLLTGLFVGEFGSSRLPGMTAMLGLLASVIAVLVMR